MDVIEKAIRSAFEKGDASERAFREKVYRQAFSALDRALQNNSAVTVETAMQRRKTLQSKIVEIEQEYVNAPPVGQPAAQPRFEEAPLELPPERTSEAPRETTPPASDISAAEDELTAPIPALTPGAPVAPPVVHAPHPVAEPQPWYEQPLQPRAERHEPDFAGYDDNGAPTVAAPADSVNQDRLAPPPRRRKGRQFVRLFIGVTLFALLALGVWWVAQMGYLHPDQEVRPVGTVEQPEPESFEPGADAPAVQSATPADNRKWISIFTPADMSAISAPSGATAELQNGEAGDYVRVRSGTSGESVLIDVGQGVLDQIAGKEATFDIVARAEDGKGTQVSVLCNFGELGDCGRKRYAVGDAKADFLFDLTLPAKKAGAGGTIAINSDFDNAGKAIDIYEIRVSVE